jgi:hypothetical protein
MQLKSYTETRHLINAMQIKWSAKAILLDKLDKSPDIPFDMIQAYKETYLNSFTVIVTTLHEDEEIKQSYFLDRETEHLALEEAMYLCRGQVGKKIKVKIFE